MPNALLMTIERLDFKLKLQLCIELALTLAPSTHSSILCALCFVVLKVQERSAAKGKLETYAYSLKHAVEDPKTADKFSPTDRNTVLDACREVEKVRSHNEAEVGGLKCRKEEGKRISSHVLVCTPQFLQDKGDSADKEEFESKYNELQSKCRYEKIHSLHAFLRWFHSAGG
jgi:hypothetical protein